MKSILQQLYNGEISPGDEFEPIIEEYAKQWETTCKAEAIFTNKLDKQQKEEFDTLMNKHLMLIPLEMAQVFSNGFKLGARIMCEVLNCEDNSKLDLLKQDGGSTDGR